MSDIQGNINLKQIVAPSLTSTNYGKDIREKFDNIDDNLRRLANRDFVAGKAGKDIKFAKYLLWDKSENNPNYSSDQKIPFTELGQAFIEAIVGSSDIWGVNNWDATIEDFTNTFYSNHSTLAPVTVGGARHTFFEYFKESPEITIMYQLDDHEAPDEEANRILICSPYVYTFIDMRYAALGEATADNPDAYTSLEDNSCLLNLTYNEGPQIERINQFPTLYYDGQGQFRWKLYGSESGILAMGPKGSDALSTPILFAKLSEEATNQNNDNTPTLGTTCTLSSILVITSDGASWVDLDSLEDPTILPKVGDPVMAFRPYNPPDPDPNDPAIISADTNDPSTYPPYTLYFTKVVGREGNIITVSTASATSVKFMVNSTMLASMLDTIRGGGMGTSCLYIPTIGNSLSGITDNTIVHAAIGSQASHEDSDIYTLTLKPIKHRYINDPNNSGSSIGEYTSKLEVNYNNVKLTGSLKCDNDIDANDIKANNAFFEKLTIRKEPETTYKKKIIIDSNSGNGPSIEFKNSNNATTTKITDERITVDYVNANKDIVAGGNIVAGSNISADNIFADGNIFTNGDITAIGNIFTPVLTSSEAILKIRTEATGGKVEVEKTLSIDKQLEWNNGPYWNAMVAELDRSIAASGKATCGWLGSGYIGVDKNYYLEQVNDTYLYPILIDWNDLIADKYTIINGATVNNNTLCSEGIDKITPDSYTISPVGVVGKHALYVNLMTFSWIKNLNNRIRSISINFPRIIKFYNCPLNTTTMLQVRFVIDHALTNNYPTTNQQYYPNSMFDPTSVQLQFYTGDKNSTYNNYAESFNLIDLDCIPSPLDYSKNNPDYISYHYFLRGGSEGEGSKDNSLLEHGGVVNLQNSEQLDPSRIIKFTATNEKLITTKYNSLFNLYPRMFNKDVHFDKDVYLHNSDIIADRSATINGLGIQKTRFFAKTNVDDTEVTDNSFVVNNCNSSTDLYVRYTLKNFPSGSIAFIKVNTGKSIRICKASTTSSYNDYKEIIDRGIKILWFDGATYIYKNEEYTYPGHIKDMGDWTDV